MKELKNEEERMMMWGRNEMMEEKKKIIEERGFKEGRKREKGELVIEKDLVEK